MSESIEHRECRIARNPTAETPSRRGRRRKGIGKSSLAAHFSALSGPRRLHLFFGVPSVLTLAIIAGCIKGPMNPAATQPATITDTATTQPGYWYQAPSRGSVVYDSFPTLYKTCENVLRDYDFKIDRIDYRTGTLTSEPLVSAQVWEPWRPDIQSIGQVRGSILASVRRTVRFDIRRNDDGRFEASPKVLVERQTVREIRITSVALYRGAYTPLDPRDTPSGSHEADEGFMYPPKYWYSIGRDPTLETSLAHEVSKRLALKGREMAEPTTQESPPGSPTTQESR